MNADFKNVNELMLKQYSEVLQHEMKTNDEYAEINSKFKKLASLTSISEAKKMFFEIFNKQAEEGSFVVNDCVITVTSKSGTLRICLDSPKDYYSFIFFKK